MMIIIIIVMLVRIIVPKMVNLYVEIIQLKKNELFIYTRYPAGT